MRRSLHSASRFRVWPLVAALLSTGVSAPVDASEPKKPTPAPSPAPAPAQTSPAVPTAPEAKPEDVATPEPSGY